MVAVGLPVIPAPMELLDPEGEGIYMLGEFGNGDTIPFGWPLIEAARRLDARDSRGRPDYRLVDAEIVYMRPSEDGEAWHRAPSAWRRDHPGWRLNLPRRWRPVAYLYCTPKP